MVEDDVLCQEVYLAEEDDDVCRVNEKNKGKEEYFPGRHFTEAYLFFEKVFEEGDDEGAVEHNFLVLNLQVLMKIVGQKESDFHEFFDNDDKGKEQKINEKHWIVNAAIAHNDIDDELNEKAFEGFPFVNVTANQRKQDDVSLNVPIHNKVLRYNINLVHV